MKKFVTMPPSIDYALIIQIATAVSHSREWGNSISQQQAFELAYDAINAHAMRGEVGDNPPRFLWFKGRQAVRLYLAASRPRVSLDENGAAVDYRDVKPRFAKYWLGHEVQDSVAEVDERIALQQVMAGLNDTQREDLEALASNFNLTVAAKQRGAGRTTFINRCKLARQTFLRLWFEGETVPPQPKRVVNRVA